MSKFKLELKKKTVEEKITLGQAHIDGMDGNANYPQATRSPSDALIQTAQDDLVAANGEVVTAEAVWKSKIQARDAKEAIWDERITARAKNCESVTPNNLEALASTAFPLRQAPTPVGVLPKPANLEVLTTGFEGEFDLRCHAVSGAKTYEWECKLHTDVGVWQSVKSSTTRKIKVTGLTPGLVYAFRVRVIGTAGPSPWSDEASARAV